MSCSCPETNFMDGKGHDPGCPLWRPKPGRDYNLPNKGRLAMSDETPEKEVTFKFGSPEVTYEQWNDLTWLKSKVTGLGAELAQARQERDRAVFKWDETNTELVEARQKIANKQEEVNKLLILVAKKRLRAESTEQQLAAAQAALLKARSLLDEAIRNDIDDDGTWHDAAIAFLAASAFTDQPTDALRGFVLGLLPEHVVHTPQFKQHNECLAEIRANLEKALEGKR